TIEALPAQAGSSSNVTGTPSTGRPWASCTRTINSVTGGNCLLEEGTGPSPMIGSATCREKTYPKPAVGPTNFGAQAPPPKASTRHIKTRAIRCAIGFSHIPTKQKRRSTGQGARNPLDPQRPQKNGS